MIKLSIKNLARFILFLSFFIIMVGIIPNTQIKQESVVQAQEKEYELFCTSSIPVGRVIDDTQKFEKTLLGYLEEIENKAEIQYNEAQKQVESATNLTEPPSSPDTPLPAQCWNGSGPAEYTCSGSFWDLYGVCCVEHHSVCDEEGNCYEVCDCFNLICASCGCACSYHPSDANDIIQNIIDDYENRDASSLSDIREKCISSDCKREDKIHSDACTDILGEDTSICPDEAENPDNPGETINCSGELDEDLCKKCRDWNCQREEMETFTSKDENGNERTIRVCPHIIYEGDIIDCYDKLTSGDYETIKELGEEASADLENPFEGIEDEYRYHPCPSDIWPLINIIKANYNNIETSFNAISETFYCLKDLIESGYDTEKCPKNKVYHQDIINKLNSTTTVPQGVRITLNQCFIPKEDYPEVMTGQTSGKVPYSCRTLLNLKEAETIVKIKGENTCNRENYPSCENDLTPPGCYLDTYNLYLNYYCCESKTP